MLRVLILTLGPIGLVGASYWLTMAGSRAVRPVHADPPPVRSPAGEVEDSLAAACHRRAAELRLRIGSDCWLIVRPPYLIGGDLPESDLDRIYRDVIVPTARALAVEYFDRAPDEPVTILMFSSEGVYRECAERLDQRQTAALYGYYWRPERRLVLNLATGYGTLAHELTHALGHFDFPALPEWFDEGLAALHEQSEFTDDGLRLNGQPNWRGSCLAQALQTGRLQRLENLLQSGGIRQEYAAFDYAHARYFCLFLQQRGLLAPFYRKLRHAPAGGSSGVHILPELLGVGSIAEVDRDFRAWARRVVP